MPLGVDAAPLLLLPLLLLVLVLLVMVPKGGGGEEGGFKPAESADTERDASVVRISSTGATSSSRCRADLRRMVAEDGGGGRVD